MKIVVVGSGSKGNTTYIETPQTKVLIDCGLSLLQTRTRLANQNITLTNIDAILITHEHGDHIKCLVSIAKKLKAKVYINEDSYYEANRKLKGELANLDVIFIKKEVKYTINDLTFVPIELSHDTVNCYGYLLKELNTDANNTFATITDTGFIPTKYYKILSSINTILVESNHDVTMLRESNRTWELIKRILSDVGHMSNEQCVSHMKKIISEHTKHIILGHISDECNEYLLALRYFEENIEKQITYNLSVAYQDIEHPIIILGDQNA